MSSSQDPYPWTEYEKIFLLAEIIKGAAPHPSLLPMLLDFMRSANIEPRWDETVGPPGRTPRSCRSAYDNMQSGGAALYPVGSGPPQSPAQQATSNPNLKRQLPLEPMYQSTVREIRPKPAVSSVFPQPPRHEPPPKRKRGRPTKEALAAKAQAAATAAAAAGVGSSGSGPAAFHRIPPAPSPISISAASTPPIISTRPPLPPTTRMPIAAILTPTTREPKSPSESGSSSGKRGRDRSTKSEPGSIFTTADIRQEGRGYDYTYAHPSRSVEASPIGSTFPRVREGFTPAATTAAQLRDQPLPPPPPPPDPPDPPDSPWSDPTNQPRRMP